MGFDGDLDSGLSASMGLEFLGLGMAVCFGASLDVTFRRVSDSFRIALRLGFGFGYEHGGYSSQSSVSHSSKQFYTPLERVKTSKQAKAWV